ncbi:hypothetical protein Sango_1611000 [Sesamum angolense]|uniref:Reverse transcriptase zinc-binding domain-containing protein n=1 Tax=Sesamum angolense TaxID=2727404 RepID=A0AAE1WJL5_9LAMI|nr:hypothetical protein Sango_1611000 [Sesamum angolense]
MLGDVVGFSFLIVFGVLACFVVTFEVNAFSEADDPDFFDLLFLKMFLYEKRKLSMLFGETLREVGILKKDPETLREQIQKAGSNEYKIPRHNFILWLAILEKLSTLDKHWISRGDNGWVLCDGLYIESHDHLFFNCLYTRRCLQIVQGQVRFHWPLSGWQHCIKWASKRWRSEHLINVASRALLAALVYYIWIERNNRKFTATSSVAESVARRVVEEVRLRILSDDFIPSLQTRTLYRIWKIAWPLGL